MALLLLPPLNLMGAFLAYRSKPHATGVQISITRLHAGTSEELVEHFHAFIPPEPWKSRGR
jgi:hypothetical protein